MATWLSDLSLESRELIFTGLELNDIKNTCLGCKVLNDATSPFLIERVWLCANSEDLETLTLIADHEVSSKSVHEIAYDST